MRSTLFLTLLAAAALFMPASASAVSGALGDQAAMNRDLGAASLEQAAHRNKARNKLYAKKHPRRYDWTYYPYWRPYQYRYWKFYYPYGGPLF